MAPKPSNPDPISEPKRQFLIPYISDKLRKSVTYVRPDEIYISFNRPITTPWLKNIPYFLIFYSKIYEVAIHGRKLEAISGKIICENQILFQATRAKHIHAFSIRTSNFRLSQSGLFLICWRFQPRSVLLKIPLISRVRGPYVKL